MGEVIIFDKSKADILSQLGFRYTTRKLDGNYVFAFVQTDELMKELDEKFESNSFVINKTVNF